MALFAGGALPLQTALAADDARVVTLPGIEVVATTPLPALAPPRDVAGNVQAFGAGDVSRQRPSGLGEFLDRNPASVTTSSASGNPFQTDVVFRGFVASPLVGTPQGLSVFMDGVRINEVFADIVNWDLVPTSAIASLQLVPGSNPVFGLNTLGGAVAIYTKDGIRFPGTAIEGSAGSFGRRTVEFENGGAQDALDWFITGQAQDDDGWREHSASRVRLLYGKLGWQRDGSSLAVSATLGDNRLAGTQALPLAMFDDPAQPYTWPDSTTNRLAFVDAHAARRLDDALVAANAYYRRLRSDGVNSNVNAQAGASPDEPAGFNVASGFVSNGYGAAAQLTISRDVAGRRNRFVAGVAGDFGRTDFSQSEQDAAFNAERETIGDGPFAPTTAVRTSTRQVGVYAADTLAVAERWSASASARWNDASVDIEDLSGSQPALTGTSRYRRLDPSAALTYAPAPDSSLYASWSQGMRVPSPVELTCADPRAPCTLPNVFVADPPLEAVVATTWEGGARLRIGATAIDAAMFRTDLANDIQFVSAGSGAVNAGYFRNVGATRRQGVEIGATVAAGAVSIVARYSFTDATYRAGFVEHSPNNSTADAAGDIVVRAGNRMPGVPRHLVKLRVEWSAAESLSIAAGLVAASPQYAHGDENNLDATGRVPGYAVVNLDARWRVTRNVELFVNAANVFDARWQNLGVLGANYFRGPGDTFAPDLAAPAAFRAPGAPFGAWAGLRYRFEGGGT